MQELILNLMRVDRLLTREEYDRTLAKAAIFRIEKAGQRGRRIPETP